MTNYIYSISGDITSGKCRVSDLKDEIDGSSISSGVCQYIETTDDELKIYFDLSLSAGDVTILDGLVQNHVPKTLTKPHAVSKIMDYFNVQSNPSFEDCGGVVTNCQYYIPDLTKAFGRLTLKARVVGTGAEIKLVERIPEDESSPVDVITAQSVSDTAGDWVLLKLNTSVLLRTGDKEFAIQARLNGATSMELKFGGVALLEILG